MTKLKFSSVLAVLFFSFSLQAQLKIQFPVEKYTLANGLTVLLAEDHSVPMISYHTWYRVGSRDEGPGVTGAAHMLEHMMFKGAKKYSGKEFDQVLHENGIVNNAFTSYDYTGFYENLPSSKLELIMDMEVDRMRSLALSGEDLKSELQVVGEERRWRVDNNPGGLLREMVMGQLFKVHPYTWPVIGYMKDIQAYTPEKLRKFYDTFYVPNNAVLVLSGDFDSKKTKALIEKYYSQLSARPLPERKYPAEPMLTSVQRKNLPWDVQTKSFVVAFQGIAAGTKDSFALDLAGNILGGGRSSRLHKKLVYESQMASSAGAYNMTNADPGAFMVMVTMKPGKSTDPAEKIIISEIEKLKSGLVSQDELQKAKNQTMMDYVDGLTTIDGKAQALAINEIIFGDYGRLFSDLEKYQQVTAADIQRVIKTYLPSGKRVIGILEPKAK
ncbi:MAG: M16 family metallopeptidase [Pseudobdellovibrionaceae bacterium]